MSLVQDALAYQQRIGGQTLRVRYYTETISGAGSVWDDARTLAQSGNDLYISGTVMALKGNDGSEDAILLEQGRIAYNDTVFFVAGSINTTSGILPFTIATSGATGVEKVYRPIEEGVNVPRFLGNAVYKKIYGRFLPNGSLF